MAAHTYKTHLGFLIFVTSGMANLFTFPIISQCINTFLYITINPRPARCFSITRPARGYDQLIRPPWRLAPEAPRDAKFGGYRVGGTPGVLGPVLVPLG